MMLSETIWRVEWDEGFGWPLCTRRERKIRRFTSEKAAAARVAIIEAIPSHHRFVSIKRGRWEEADEPVGYDTPAEAADAMVGPLPPVGCSRCGLIPAPPGECPSCGERARFVAHISRDDDE